MSTLLNPGSKSLMILNAVLRNKLCSCNIATCIQSIKSPASLGSCKVKLGRHLLNGYQAFHPCVYSSKNIHQLSNNPTNYIFHLVNGEEFDRRKWKSIPINRKLFSTDSALRQLKNPNVNRNESDTLKEGFNDSIIRNAVSSPPTRTFEDVFTQVHEGNVASESNPDFESDLTIPQKFVNACPDRVAPYLKLMRLDRPIGTWLLFWPCGWGIALAAGAGHLPDLWLLSVFATGSLVMRGAGCTLNDMWDRGYDSKVSRTRDRPLASGAVTPLDGMVFLGAQLSVGLIVLLQLSVEAIMLGASSLLLVCGYPLAKRVTYWPQLVLGLTFNWGALLGYCAVQSTVLHLPVLALYSAGVCWTLIYDTIYAHQDKADDLQIGVKSTALKFGANTGEWLCGFSAAMVACLLTTGYSAGLAWPYYGAVAGTAAHLAFQIRNLDINSPTQCGHQFRQHRHVGLLLFLGLASGCYLATPAEDASDGSSLDTPPQLPPAEALDTSPLPASSVSSS